MNLKKKLANLATNERRGLLLHTMIVLPDRVKRYLDAEAVWYRRKVEYLEKFRKMKAIQEKVAKERKER
jgi:hypothetical protein